MTRYARIAELAGLHPDAVRGFLAEELLSGLEVTYEGYVHEGRVVTIGVTDSQKYEGTNSFERFEFPSALPAERLAELEDVSTRLMPALGFDGGFFNVEFFIPDEGPARIIEVNGRIASQFWPLVQAVLGRSTYDAMFRLACGEDPGMGARPPSRASPFRTACASSRTPYVESVPEVDDDELELLVRPGLRLSQQGVNDTSQLPPLHLPELRCDPRGGVEHRQGACRRPRFRPLARDRCGRVIRGEAAPRPRRSARLASPSQPRSGARPRPS